MKYFVNENCIGCGLCSETCPDVFEMTDDGLAMAVDAEVSSIDEDAAEEARLNCPVEAIEEA